jgi:hypothetical protein
LQEFTPQINYSNAITPTGWSSSSDPSQWFDLKAPYGKDFAYYNVDPDQIDRVGAPPVATGPPDKYGQDLGGATAWWMTSAQLTAPMQVTSAYDGSGTISNTDFEINWRVPSIPNPCREASPTPSVPDNASDNLVTDPWSSSPQSCDESVDANKKITNRVFDSWDEWLVALVVREERQIKTINETPDYKYTPLSSLRCGNNNEFSQASSAWQDNCSGDNRWNGLTYTPLADPSERSPQKRSQSGSMQFAQGYLVARAPACPTSRAPETSAGQTTSNYCAGKPITSGPQMEATPGISSAAWQNKLVQLKWWEKAALRIKADTNRKDKVRGFTLWSRDQVLGTSPNQYRLAPGWNPSFSTLPEDTTPLQGGITPAALGQEKSNTNATEINTRSGSIELKFCRQALPPNSKVNYGTENDPRDDRPVPDQLTDKMPGSENCAGWAKEWRWHNPDIADNLNQCSSDSKDAPSTPTWNNYKINSPNDNATDAQGGKYHTTPPPNPDNYYDPSLPTNSGQAKQGTSLSSARFYGGPYTGNRPGVSGNLRHCTERVVGKPSQGYWTSYYAFQKLNQTSTMSSGSAAPTAQSNCRFVNGPSSANNSISKALAKEPGSTVGPAPTSTTCRHYYDYNPRSSPPNWNCQYRQTLSNGKKRYVCDWHVGSTGYVYQSFGFWARTITAWVWYHGKNNSAGNLICHVGSDAARMTNVVTSTNLASLRYAPGTVGGSGGTFASPSDVSSATTSYGDSVSKLVYIGGTRAWDNSPIPGGQPAKNYVQSTWTCSYDKSDGYVVNGNSGALAGDWQISTSAGVGWGVNNSGPRIYTGADWNQRNVGTYNVGKPADSKRYINDGWGYMTQLSFDRLSSADLANPVGENLGSIGRAGDRRSGAGTPDWTNAGESGNCPVPDNFFRGKVYDPLLPRSNPAGDIQDSVYSAPGTCWRLLASYNTNANDQWQYRVVKDDLKPDEGDDPKQLQKFVKVYNPRGSR